MTNWLLLHGTPLTPAVWDGVLSYLSGDVAAPVVTPDVESTPRDQQSAIATRLSAVRAGAGPPWHVVGHSFGGQVALELAIQAPELVSRLTLLCTRDTPYPPFAVAATRTLDAPVDDTALHRWFGPDELAANGAAVRYARATLLAADRSEWARALAAIAVFDCAAQTSAIRCPTTVIAAERDEVSTPEAMGAMCSRLIDGEFILLEDARHMSVFTDPVRLAALLNRH